MKVVDVAEFYAERGGGVKTYLNAEIAFGARHGHEIVVVAPGAESRTDPRDGGRVVWVKSPPTPDPRYRTFWRSAPVFKVLDRERPDIVVGSSPWIGGRIVAKWRGRSRKVMFMHQDPVAAYGYSLLGRKLRHDRVDRLFAWYWWLLRRLTNRYDLTIVGSQWFAGRLAKFGFREPKVVPLGIDKSLFLSAKRDPARRSDLLARCGATPDATLFLAVSRHHPEKRLDLVIDAFEALNAGGGHGLVIVGDGPIRRRIERRAARVPGVHVMGFVPDREVIASILASADYFVHGGAFEPFGLAVAEAMCAGLPMVVPETGGAGELAQPSFSETYPPNGVADCAEAMRRLMARDRNQLVDACRAAAREQVFAADDHFLRLFEAYAELLGRAPAPASAPADATGKPGA